MTFKICFRRLTHCSEDSRESAVILTYAQQTSHMKSEWSTNARASSSRAAAAAAAAAGVIAVTCIPIDLRPAWLMNLSNNQGIPNLL